MKKRENRNDSVNNKRRRGGRYLNTDEYRFRFNSEDRIAQIERIIDYNLGFNELRKYYYLREKYLHYFLTNEKYLQIPEEKRKEVRINLKELHQFYQIRRGMYVRRNMSGVYPALTANMRTREHNVSLVRVNVMG